MSSPLSPLFWSLCNNPMLPSAARPSPCVAACTNCRVANKGFYFSAGSMPSPTLISPGSWKSTSRPWKKPWSGCWSIADAACKVQRSPRTTTRSKPPSKPAVGTSTCKAPMPPLASVSNFVTGWMPTTVICLLSRPPNVFGASCSQPPRCWAATGGIGANAAPILSGVCSQPSCAACWSPPKRFPDAVLVAPPAYSSMIGVEYGPQVGTTVHRTHRDSNLFENKRRFRQRQYRRAGRQQPCTDQTGHPSRHAQPAFPVVPLQGRRPANGAALWLQPRQRQPVQLQSRLDRLQRRRLLRSSELVPRTQHL